MYGWGGAVIREGLRLRDERDKLLEIRCKALQPAVKAGPERGEYVEGKAFFSDGN